MPEVNGQILALDLATNTGFCLGAPDAAPPKFGEVSFSGKGLAAFGIAYEDWLGEMLMTQDVALLIFESPILPPRTSFDTLRKLYGMAFATEVLAKRWNVPCREGRNQTVKKFFAGHGRAEKADTMEICRRYGWKVPGDDAADACALWAYAVACFSSTHRNRFILGPIGAGTGA